MTTQWLTLVNVQFSIVTMFRCRCFDTMVYEYIYGVTSTIWLVIHIILIPTAYFVVNMQLQTHIGVKR